MIWRESVEKVERAGLRTEPSSKQAKEPMKETDHPGEPALCRASELRRKGHVQYGPMLQGHQSGGFPRKQEIFGDFCENYFSGGNISQIAPPWGHLDNGLMQGSKGISLCLRSGGS